MKNESIIVVGDKSYIKSKVFMLPTEKAVNNLTPFICNGKLFAPPTTQEFVEKMVTDKNYWKPQNIHFLSDEPIEQGNWSIPECVNEAFNNKPIKYVRKDDKMKDCIIVWDGKEEHLTTIHLLNKAKKIIASTDEELCVMRPIIKTEIGYTDLVGRSKINTYGNVLPRPSNEFLQAYCKADGKIDEALIELDEYETLGNDILNSNLIVSGDKIFKLKVAPDNTITTKRVPEKRTYTEQEMKSFAKQFAIDMYNEHYGRNHISFKERVDTLVDSSFEKSTNK